MRSFSASSKLSAAIASLFALIFCTNLVAQDNSTLDGFKNKNPQKQKAPHRQLAKNYSPSALDLNDPGKTGQQEKAKPNQEKPNSKTAKKPQDKQQTNKNQQSNKKPTKKTSPSVSPERLKEITAFIEEHHAELNPLLKRLEKNHKGQYNAAIRNLDRNVRNLQSLKKRNNAPERYQRSLDHWIISSKIQLLTASMALKKTDKEKKAAQEQIRPLIAKQYDLRIEQVQSDHAAAKAKFEKLEKQLNAIKSKRSAEITKRMKDAVATSKRISDQRKKSMDKKKSVVNEKKPAKQNNNNE